MFTRRRANIYMDAEGLYYTIKNKKNNIHGKVLFGDEDFDAYLSKLKILRQEAQKMVKQNKVKDFNIVLTEGIRMVKVFRYDNELKLNGDIDIILREEVSKYIQPTEDMNDYSIHYLKTHKKSQDVFLTAVIQKRTLIELCAYAIQDKFNMHELVIPEIRMYELIKDKSGVNVIGLYNEKAMELRLLVCENEKILYTNQVTNLYSQDIVYELKNLESHLMSQFNRDVKGCYMLGADNIYIEESNDVRKIQIDGLDSRYSLVTEW